VVTTKKQTRQTNLMPAFNYFISWNIGTVGYISYYLYSQNQSLQKQAYVQSNTLKQDAVYQN